MICEICGSGTEGGFGYDCDCNRVAYRIFGYYGYEHIAHSGGLCPLVHILGGNVKSYEKVVLNKLGWRSKDGTHWRGPWGSISPDSISLYPEVKTYGMEEKS